jgi:hypothetical protein
MSNDDKAGYEIAEADDRDRYGALRRYVEETARMRRWLADRKEREGNTDERNTEERSATRQ